MFEDIRQGTAIDRSAPDRVIAYALWSRDTASTLSPSEAWTVLAERYPNDVRFLLFAVFADYEGRGKEWNPGTFLDRVWALLERAGGKLNPEVRDLLAVVSDDLHPLAEPAAARLERIRGRVGARFGDGAAARKRMTRLAGTVIREIHERTQSGGSLARLAAAKPDASAWSEAVAGAAGDKTTYDASAKVAVGALVAHPKFGLGVVIGTEPGRANILFESGARKLVCG
jgi:hypothetical protein